MKMKNLSKKKRRKFPSSLSAMIILYLVITKVIADNWEYDKI